MTRNIKEVKGKNWNEKNISTDFIKNRQQTAKSEQKIINRKKMNTHTLTKTEESRKNKGTKGERKQGNKFREEREKQVSRPKQN